MQGVMRITSTVLALALTVAPLAAQGGPARGQGPAMGRGMMQGGPAAMLRNPATLVLEHRDALELTAEQVDALETIEVEIERQNGPRWEQLKEAFGDADPAEMSREERQALRDRMQELAPVREEVRQTNRTLMASFHEMLTAEQETALREIMRRNAPGRQGPGMRGRSGRPGDAVLGAAWRSGFRTGLQRCRALPGGAGPRGPDA